MLRRHRRREERGLALFRQRGENRVELVREAHVEHFVRLVEHDRLDGLELERPTADVIERAARRRHDHVDAALQRPQLLRDRLAAVDRQYARAERAAVGVHGFRDLHRELPRRYEDQAAQRTRAVTFAAPDAVEQRQRGRRRLSRAGGSLPEHVAAGQQRRNRLALDVGRFFVPERGQRARERRVETERCESVCFRCMFRGVDTHRQTTFCALPPPNSTPIADRPFMKAVAILAAGLLAGIALGCEARDCRSTGVAARHNGDIVVSNGADLFLFGRNFQLENQLSRHVKSDAYDPRPYASFALDFDGTLYVPQRFRYARDYRATKPRVSSIPYFTEVAADVRSGIVYLVHQSPNAVSIGRIDRAGTFRRAREVPLAFPADRDPNAIASDPAGGYCLAWDHDIGRDYAHTMNEHHIECWRKGLETFVYHWTADPGRIDSLSDLAVLPDGDIAVTGLSSDVCLLHRTTKTHMIERCSPRERNDERASGIATDGTSFIVNHFRARTVTAYDSHTLRRTWIMSSVGDASAPPLPLAVANGVLYVGEHPDVLPNAQPDRAPHDVLRFRLRGNHSPERMRPLSGTFLGFDSSHNVTPLGNDRLLVSQSVIASASGVPRAIRKEDSDRILRDEELLAFAPNGRSFASGGDGSLVEYPLHPLMADRPIRPIDDRVLSGSPYAAMAANDAGVVFRSDPWTASIVIMSRGSDAERPLSAVIAGPQTQLADPNGLAIDSSGNLYVANQGGDDVLVFASGAVGNVMPIGVIGNTKSLHRPTGVSIANDGSVLVADNSAELAAFGPPFNSKLTRFSSGGELLDSTEFPSSCRSYFR